MDRQTDRSKAICTQIFNSATLKGVSPLLLDKMMNFIQNQMFCGYMTTKAEFIQIN
jgi:hypothetical protein